MLTKIKTFNLKTITVATLIIALLAAAFPAASEAVSEQALRNQINRLNDRIASSENVLEDLGQKKNTLENKLAVLRAEIDKFQSQINLTEAKIDKTKKELAETERDLAQKKKIMQENAKKLYKNGDPTIAEVLFASDNFSEFVNKQEYLEKVKEAVNEAAQAVVTLQEQLEKEEARLQDLLLEQQGQKNALEAKKREQQKILDETRGEEARYQEKVENDEAALAEATAALQAEIARRTAPISGSGHFGSGSYPWSTACMNPYPAPAYINLGNCGIDGGGYFYRQCTSYAYWRRGNLGRPVPGWWGNGGDWANNARASGYEVNYTPRKGAIGVMPGFFGHVFIVEEVLGGGAIRASQYNYSGANGGRWGEYSEVTFYDTSGIQFVHDRL